MANVTVKFFKAFFFAFALVAIATPVYADDVTESIDEAVKYYKDGDLSEAVNSLNYAAQLIQQKKGDKLKAFLPEPLKGWEAGAAESQAMAAGMMGGGLSASRDYSKDGSSVEVDIVTDSPMLQGMMMMFTNPMFAASDGGKLEKVNGQKAVVKYDDQDKSGEINVVVANRFLVTIKGFDVSKADLKAYGEAIDYKKLENMP